MLPKTIIHLLSGGLDSTVLLYDLLKQGHAVHCLLCDYKQRHAQELTFARLHCRRAGAQFTTFELPQLPGSSLTDGSGGVVVPSGFCKCPGEEVHTGPNAKKDCRVNVDGAPTIFCFHSSCAGPVAEANRLLRRELGTSPWELTLPGGRVLRSGDVLQQSGEVLKREVIQARARAEGRETGECVVLETVRVLAERFKPELFEVFRWPLAEVLVESPLQVSERDAEDQFRTWLRLWPACSTVWIGDVYSSGKPEHRTHFRPVAEWYQIGPAMGNFTCGSSFKPESFSRCNENLNGQRFLVIESDTLAKDDVGAVFAYLRRRLRYRLHCIIDTAGKSLHAWFDAPRNRVFEARLKAGLEVFGCDPKVFTYSQPVRVPGAYREGKLQRLIWLKA